MKRQISLKLFVTLAFLSLGVVLVTGYSMLSAHYYRMGMNSVTASDMEGAAHSYLELVPPARRNQLDNFRGYQIAAHWEHIPRAFKEVFRTPPAEPGFTVKVGRSKWFAPPDAMYFVYRYQSNDQTLFVTRHGSRDTAPPLIGRNAAESREMLFGISVLIAGVLGGVILLLLRRVSRPVAALGQWAHTLNAENLNKPLPDFSYPELNDLAGLIRTSLSSVQESLAREHRFLSYASHELRTPITIIRNNIELLRKIKETQGSGYISQQEKVINRIDRASLNMQYLTETLLWLSKKEMVSLPVKCIQLDKMLAQLVEEMEYLLDRKEVELKLETRPCTVFLPEFPVQIILGNLIRNAFQYTWEGCINIFQEDNRVVVTNPQSPADTGQNDVGFGLGLQLTAQLTKKLDWRYVDESTTDVHKASITFGSEGGKLTEGIENR
ncbi:HAMP domain-containing sensor histidine kinase [Desulforhopalus sp. IMCC35007]|uniref:sensor histidine kinase n=1 Tax=Desulforhopalus sp. IMCC35007 TaxID=2569543 RepID=UPI0010AE141F|nr:HAMP domain-containing sensor histidine kinase [Desulforhopalus sp. IMCC35007]TKB09665.1 HAMP domain-containing histidine kinase [Desulforhopalus sp. IMCC35007]